MRYGCDYLFGNHYEQAMLRSHPDGWAAGIFIRTAGDARSTARKMGAHARMHEVVTHLAPFDNSHRYPIKQLLPQMLNDAQWLYEHLPHEKLLLSPFCEHKHTRREMATVFEQLRERAPNARFVNAIIPGYGEEVPDTITEIHLPDSRPVRRPRNELYTVSFDGFGGNKKRPGDFPDCNVPEILERYLDALHIRWWNFRNNGKYGHLDTTPINQRKYWPSIKYLRNQHAMMKVREGRITWPKDQLYKAQADDHGGAESSKDNKAMAILHVNREVVYVYDSENTVIDAMKRVRPDHKLGPRYYSKLYAYELAEKARKYTGSSLIRVHDMPVTDGNLRSNDFV